MAHDSFLERHTMRNGRIRFWRALRAAGGGRVRLLYPHVEREGRATDTIVHSKVATHLGLSLRERRSQINKLLAMLGGRDDPTLAMGDFNDWFWAGSVRRNLARVLPDCSRHRTFPAVLPLFALDGIYLWPSGLLVASRTDPEARTLSDHLPVIADIDLGRANA